MDLILLDAIFKITKPQTNFLFNLCRQEDAHISEIQPTLYHHNKYYDKQLNNLINCLLLCTFNVSWSQERQRNLKPKVIRCLLIRGPEGSKDKTKYQAPATPLFSFLPLPFVALPLLLVHLSIPAEVSQFCICSVWFFWFGFLASLL